MAATTRQVSEELLFSIRQTEREIGRLRKHISERESTLKRFVVSAFNEQSEPIDGVTIEDKEVNIGKTECELSPITVCVYALRVMSIPGQKALKAAGYDDGDTPATASDACLFCGIRSNDHG